MTGLNRPARLNRGLLATIGVLLLAGGGFVLAGYLGWIRVFDPQAPLAPGTAAPPTWVLVTIAAVAAVVGLLCLRWLAAQLAHTPRTHPLHLERDPRHGHTDLPAGVATQPLREETETYPGVHAVQATLAGTRGAPVLVLVISTEPDADLGAIHHRLDTHGLPRFRAALDLASLPAQVEFRFRTAQGARVLR